LEVTLVFVPNSKTTILKQGSVYSFAASLSLMVHLALCLSELSTPLKNSCVRWFPQNSTINGSKHTTDGPEVARILREQFCTDVAT
jgi:hypothetical protein